MLTRAAIRIPLYAVAITLGINMMLDQRTWWFGFVQTAVCIAALGFYVSHPAHDPS